MIKNLTPFFEKIKNFIHLLRFIWVKTTIGCKFAQIQYF